MSPASKAFCERSTSFTALEGIRNWLTGTELPFTGVLGSRSACLRRTISGSERSIARSLLVLTLRRGRKAAGLRVKGRSKKKGDTEKRSNSHTSTLAASKLASAHRRILEKQSDRECRAADGGLLQVDALQRERREQLRRCLGICA